MRSLTLAAITAAALASAGVAHANVIDNIDLTFATGAEFIGTLNLTDDFSAVNSLVGTLIGYDAVVPGYLDPSYSDPFNVVTPTNYCGGNGAACDPSVAFFSEIMDHSDPSLVINWLDFGYTYDASGITFSAGGVQTGSSLGLDNLNSVDQFDALTSVPEPATLALLGFGLLGLGATRRRRTTSPSIG
jgi:hypothetical protein